MRSTPSSRGLVLRGGRWSETGSGDRAEERTGDREKKMEEIRDPVNATA